MNISTHNINRARIIPGWMSDYELHWLAEEASKRKVIVEIGSYLGRSTRALADNTNGTVYAVDDWYGPRDVDIRQEDRPKLFDEFLKNMDGLQGRLNVVKADHKNVVIDYRPDFVFIDGSHRYEDVRFDIIYWLGRAEPGAIISGHDYFLPDVYRAVNEIIPTAKLAPQTSIWYYEKFFYEKGQDQEGSSKVCLPR